MAGGRGRLHVSYDFSGIDYLSLQIVLRELERLYLEPDARLPDIDISFRDYVLWEAAQRHTVQYRIAARYWKARLDSLPMGPDLPLEVRPAEVSRPRVVRHQASLAPARWQALKQHAAARGLTPSGVLLTAFADVLRVWSRRPSFTLNLPVFNRAPVHPQVGALVGDFTSLLLLEVAAPAVADSFADRALALQSQLWRDFDHRDFSGVQFLRELARVSDDRRGATMPVVFTSLLPLDTDPTGDGAAAGRLFDQAGFTLTQTPQVWIDHQVHERGGSLLFNWDVVEELFPTGMIGDMFAAFCARLERPRPRGRLGPELARGRLRDRPAPAARGPARGQPHRGAGQRRVPAAAVPPGGRGLARAGGDHRARAPVELRRGGGTGRRGGRRAAPAWAASRASWSAWS